MKQVSAIPIIKIKFPVDGKLRSRKVVSRSNVRNTGKYPSWKMQRMVHWESPHEANAMYLLDTCPAVLSFNEQPCEIFFELDGQPRRHFPDLLVKGDQWQELCEVKTREESERPEVRMRTEFLAQHLPFYGYDYRLVLAEDLAFKPRLKNAARILKLGRIALTNIERERIRQLFMTYETLPWGALQSDQGNPHLQRHICRLILEGFLAFDMSKELTEATAIRWIFNQQNEGEKSWASLISKKSQ